MKRSTLDARLNSVKSETLLKRFIDKFDSRHQAVIRASCGATLPDPHKILLGSGNQNRFIRLESAKRLADAEALIAAAIAQGKTPLARAGPRQTDHQVDFRETETPPQAREVSNVSRRCESWDPASAPA